MKMKKIGTYIALAIWIGVSHGAWAADLPKGVFDLVGSEKSFSTTALQSPYVTGIVIRTFWSTVEPTEGNYNWQYIDSSLQAAQSYNKVATIFVASGVSTPTWVYDAGAQKFSMIDVNPYHATYGQTFDMPIPWDGVYLQKWAQFVKAFGARYDSHSAVHHVVLANPTPFSLEMYMPHSKEDQQHLREAGYTDDRVFRAWQQIIDAYAQAFPSKPWAISIAPVMSGTQLTDRIVSYGLQKYGKRMLVQASWLSAHTTSQRLAWVSRYTQQTTVGFQMLWASSWNAQSNDRQGDLLTSIQKGIQAGASFLEIYEADIINPDYANDIKYAAENLGATITASAFAPSPRSASPQKSSAPSGPMSEARANYQALVEEIRAAGSALQSGSLDQGQGSIDSAITKVDQLKSQLTQVSTELESVKNALQRCKEDTQAGNRQMALQDLRLALQGLKQARMQLQNRSTR